MMRAETAGNQKGELTLGAGYMGAESNSPPGSCGCFVLHGGFADAGWGLGRGFDGGSSSCRFS